MKLVSRRLRRLEERFGPAIETEFTRRLRERIEAGRRRVAVAAAQVQQGQLCQPDAGRMPDAQRERLREIVGFRAAPNRYR